MSDIYEQPSVNVSVTPSASHSHTVTVSSQASHTVSNLPINDTSNFVKKNELSGNYYPIDNPNNYITGVNLVANVALFVSAATGAISTGHKGEYALSSTTTFLNWKLFSSTTGSLTLDVQKSSFDTYPHFVTIVNGNYPTLVNGLKNTGDATEWMNVLSNSDVLRFVVVECSGISQFNFTITGVKNG